MARGGCARAAPTWPSRREGDRGDERERMRRWERRGDLRGCGGPPAAAAVEAPGAWRREERGERSGVARVLTWRVLEPSISRIDGRERPGARVDEKWGL